MRLMEKKKEMSAPRCANGLNSFATAAMPLLRRIVGKKGLVIADMLAMWEQIVGEETAAYTMPERLDFPRGQHDNGTLRIKVPGGAFALEVQHRERFLLEKINAYFGYKAVGGIKIIQDPSLSVKPIVHRKEVENQKTLVSEEEQNYIDAMVSKIASAGLREKLAKLGQSVFNRKRK